MTLNSIAEEWRKMKENADIIEAVNNDWYQRVGTAIFSAQVINIVIPQITVLVNVFIGFIQDFPK